jgi:hypothetical protein
VRELLHQRVAVAGLAASADEQHQALQHLQQRWESLIAREGAYRHSPEVAATAP